MVINIEGIFQMVNLMVKELIYIWMELYLEVIGNKDSLQELVKLLIHQVHGIKENLKIILNTEKECINGKVEIYTKVNGKKINIMV